jgi:hypothetical protein
MEQVIRLGIRWQRSAILGLQIFQKFNAGASGRSQSTNLQPGESPFTRLAYPYYSNSKNLEKLRKSLE